MRRKKASAYPRSPTKKECRRPSRIEYIERGLDTFTRTYRDIGVTSVAFPPLGCGNGELRWDDVRPVMEAYLSPLPIPVYLYPPQPRIEVAEHRTPVDMSVWLREQPRALGFHEVWDDLVVLIGPAGRTFEATTKKTPIFVVFE